MSRQEAEKYLETLPLRERVSTIRRMLEKVELELAAQEAEPWPDIDLDSITGGEAHPVHHLRLIDAVDTCRSLLKKYGHIKGVLSPVDVLRAEGLAAGRMPLKQGDWAHWVARDSDTLDRPKTVDWTSWVTEE